MSSETHIGVWCVCLGGSMRDAVDDDNGGMCAKEPMKSVEGVAAREATLHQLTHVASVSRSLAVCAGGEDCCG